MCYNGIAVAIWGMCFRKLPIDNFILLFEKNVWRPLFGFNKPGNFIKKGISVGSLQRVPFSEPELSFKDFYRNFIDLLVFRNGNCYAKPIYYTFTRPTLLCAFLTFRTSVVINICINPSFGSRCLPSWVQLSMVGIIRAGVRGVLYQFGMSDRIGVARILRIFDWHLI